MKENNLTYRKIFLVTLLVAFFALLMPNFAFADEVKGDTSAEGVAEVKEETAPTSEANKTEDGFENKESVATTTSDATADQATSNQATVTQATATSNATATQTTETKVPAGGEQVLADGHVYIISSEASGKSMEIAGGSQSSSVATSQYETNNTLAQQWKVKYDSNNYVTFVNVNSNKAIDVDSAQAISGAKVQQYGQNDTLAQKWIVIRLADGTYMIASAIDSNLVLDVESASQANGAKIWLYAYNGTAAQKWHFFDITSGYAEIQEMLTTNNKLISAGVYEITSKCSDKALDVAGGSEAAGANVQMYEKNNTFAQYWRISYDDQGYACIESLASGKVLDVADASTSPSANVQQYNKNNTAAQKWVFALNGNGTYCIISALFPGLVLDISGASTKNCANVQVYSFNETEAQMWIFRKIEDFLDSGYYTIASKIDSSKVLDLSEAGHDDNTRVQIYNYNQTFAQKWYFSQVSASKFTIQSLESGKYLTANSNGNIYQHTKLSDTSQNWIVYVYAGHYYLTNEMTNMVLDVAGAENRSGALVRMYALNWTSAQAWKINGTSAIEDGKYFIITSATDSSMALGIKGGNTSDTTFVDLGTKTGDSTQKWLFVKNADGTYTLINAAARKTMDVKDGTTTSGTAVQIYTQNNTSAQKWHISWDASKGYFIIASALNENLRLSIAGDKAKVGTNTQIQTANSNTGQFWHLELTSYTSFLRGIDISSWQAGIDIYAIDADFVIVKVTQGTWYENKGDGYYWKDWANQVLASGKKLGLYHYAEGGDANAEAEFFYSKVKDFVGRAVLVIDWESAGNAGYSENGDWWTSAWRARVKELTGGITAWSYVNGSTYQNYSGPLWIAAWEGANSDPNYTTGYQDAPWNESAYPCFCRQYTSKGRISGYGDNLDLNKFYGSREDWDAWASGSRA